jgi:hypothetical protein
MPKRAAPLPDHPDCLNCGTELRGQYCGSCGQRATSRLISLWELLRDGFGDLLDIDSRLWRTLIPLLIRPGQLTLDYLQGRRARYMPPFRMYLVLSVVFFIIAFFDPRDDLSVLFEPEPTPEEQAEQEDKRDESLDEAEQTIQDLAAEGVLSPEDAERALAGIESNKERGGSVTLYGDDDGDDGDDGLNFQYDEDTGDCVVTGVDRLPDWFQRRLTQERLERICERVGADDGKTLGSLLLDNIPVALIVLLPFMALVLKGLYPLSRRYFVEHLLFFVHFHSFFFLILTLQILFGRLGPMVFLPEPVVILVLVAASLYIPVYLYKAMRRVYGQGHLLTAAKYIVLTVTYFFGAMSTMMGALLVALFSV